MSSAFFDYLKGREAPPYVIAEVGSNHNGDMALAREMIDAAKACGCDAVKFQSWSPSSLISSAEYARNQRYYDSPKKHFGSLREMTERYHLREEQHHELSRYCKGVGIDFCSSHFSKEEADLLRTLDVGFFKIASMDINNDALLSYTAKLGKPILLSTGMATFGEIDRAVRLLEEHGNREIVLLHCVSLYPPPYETIHLRNIPMLAQAFGYPMGFSDHSLAEYVAIGSVALGCKVIEKHFTIDNALPGWDHEMSANPEQMTRLVEAAKAVYYSLGSVRRVVSQEEEEKKLKFRRSLVAARALVKGTRIGPDDVGAKRPGYGIRPDEVKYVVGRRLKRDLAADQQLSWEDLE